MTRITRTSTAIALASALVFAFVAHAARAEDKAGEAKEQAALAKALAGVAISLEKGLDASASEGKAISAKFEIEDGKLQLSVYTMKGDKFSEVIVDHKTAKVSKTEAITEAEDLSAAKEQSAAMAKATSTLAVAVGKVTKANTGFRAVSATPSLKDGHPVAEITLLKGDQTKKVSEKLD